MSKCADLSGIWRCQQIFVALQSITVHSFNSHIMQLKISILLCILTSIVAEATTAVPTGLKKMILPVNADTMPTLLIDRPDFDSLLTVSRYKENLPAGKFGPVVFGKYHFLDTVPMIMPNNRDPRFASAYKWLDNLADGERMMADIRQRYEIASPLTVRYNAAYMPDVPKEFRAFIDKGTTRIKFEEIKIDHRSLNEVQTDIEQRHWLKTFDASLQFSQAYISPNWYQGGNNNLNMIGQINYNVKLNQKFYPKILCETNIQYKLALNSAPDDSIHSYNITEDIFQLNTTFGYKAARRWYYSANILFKTQIFNSYPTNSRNRNAALLSPGELNVGLGMTYSYANPKKTVNFGTSISPLSWNLKTCINDEVDETAYGLERGHKTKNKIGSSAECTLEWKIAYNIVYHSRLFLFTDYDYAYGDWEHTVDFNINRFLSTRLYVHMRYDTSTPSNPDNSWRKFQLKEIFSFGFAYHFGTI